MHKRIFISKNASEVETLNDYLISQGKDLVPHSFLQFSQLEFQLKDQYDVIFFGSPRSVSFFTAQCEIPESVQIACVGGKTTEAIQGLNRKVDFNGENNGDINEVALAFKQWCEDKKILFPISSLSLKTISSQFKEHQKIELKVYRTDILGYIIQDCDTYVFTSPSNVKGFLELNSLPKNAEVIAWGESTSSALSALKIKVAKVLSKPSIEELKSFL